MFDGGGPGGFDMSELLAQAQAMQNQLLEAQANLESQQVEGSAGGGLVTATVSGTGDLVGLSIKPEAVDPEDTETLADLVVAAVRDAAENAKQLAAQAMGPLAGGLGGPGGLDMSGAGGLPGGLGFQNPAGSSLTTGSAGPGERTSEDASGPGSVGPSAEDANGPEGNGEPGASGQRLG